MAAKKIGYTYNPTKEEAGLRQNELFLKEGNINYAKNDELLKYHLITKKLKEYACYEEKCPTKKGNWRRKPMYLILDRKNGILTDLRVSNLHLICPNCYCQNKGPIQFNIIKKKIEKKCRLCSYVLNNTSFGDICYVCNNKLSQLQCNISDELQAKMTIQNFDKETEINEDSIKLYKSLNNVQSRAGSSSSSKKHTPTKGNSRSKNIDASIVDNIDITIDDIKDFDESLLDSI